MKKRSKQAPKRRLPQQIRRQLIIDQAIRFFAEKGFAASTRELAERIGIAQPLLFQHFRTKSDLVNAIFDTLFDRMASRDWHGILKDRSRDLRVRLIDFFSSYATALYDYHWIRIYMFAGLEGGAFNRLYITKVTEPLLREIAAEIRASRDMKDCAPSDATAREIELLWILHGGLYYSAIRKQIYGMKIESMDVRPLVEAGVDSVLAGMEGVLGAEAPASRMAVGRTAARRVRARRI